MGAVVNKASVALVVTVLALAVLIGLNFIGEFWLAMVIGLETIVGTYAAGIVGILLTTPLTFVLMYGLKDPRA